MGKNTKGLTNAMSNEELENVSGGLKILKGFDPFKGGKTIIYNGVLMNEDSYNSLGTYNEKVQQKDIVSDFEIKKKDLNLLGMGKVFVINDDGRDDDMNL